MEYLFRRRTTALPVLAVLALLVSLVVGVGPGQAAALRASARASSAEGAPTCVIHSLPAFTAQGEFGGASTVADIVEVECKPTIYGFGAPVKITASQLASRCAGKLEWIQPYPYQVVTGSGIEVTLDADGNATVALRAGPGCTAGESLISAHQREVPYETFTTSFTVLPPADTRPGLFAMPKAQVEDANGSGVATIVEVEFPSVYAEKFVHIAAEELFSRCQTAPHLVWIPESGKALSGTETIDKVKLDNNGNAFVIVIGGASCASGTSIIEADLESSPFTTYTTTFTVESPQPTEEPAFTIEKRQQIAGSGAGFTASPLTGTIGQTADYQVTVKNTAHVAETFSEFSDTHCDAGTIAGGPGSNPVPAGGSTTYTCSQLLTAVGSYTNEATVTGNSAGGSPLRHTSNQVVVTVAAPREPAFTIEKRQEIAGSAGGFTTSPLSGLIGQTVDYEIVIKNTGNVPLTFSNFSDPHCDSGTIAGGPGEAPLAPGATTPYTCNHLLVSVGSYINEATVTGTPQGEAPIALTSHPVEVVVWSGAGRYTIEKLQRIAGSGGSFTTSPLTGAIGQTVEYEIVVKNTGSLPVTLSNFTDARCDAGTISGGPGGTPLAPGATTTYTCSHILTSVGKYVNEASVTGTPQGEPPITRISGFVEVNVPAAPKPPAPAGAPAPTATKGILPFTCQAPGTRLRGISGPKWKAFTVRVSAIGISQITFYLDGRSIKTMTQAQARGGAFTIEVKVKGLSHGAHRLTVKTVASTPGCSSPARSGVFVRPLTQHASPKFTG
jgi:hypothetical protein